MRFHLSVVLGNKSFEKLVIGRARLNDDPRDKHKICQRSFDFIDKPCCSISEISLSLRMNSLIGLTCEDDVREYQSGVPLKFKFLSFNGIQIYVDEECQNEINENERNYFAEIFFISIEINKSNPNRKIFECINIKKSHTLIPCTNSS